MFVPELDEVFVNAVQLPRVQPVAPGHARSFIRSRVMPGANGEKLLCKEGDGARGMMRAMRLLQTQPDNAKVKPGSEPESTGDRAYPS